MTYTIVKLKPICFSYWSNFSLEEKFEILKRLEPFENQIYDKFIYECLLDFIEAGNVEPGFATIARNTVTLIKKHHDNDCDWNCPFLDEIMDFIDEIRRSSSKNIIYRLHNIFDNWFFSSNSIQKIKLMKQLSVLVPAFFTPPFTLFDNIILRKLDEIIWPKILSSQIKDNIKQDNLSFFNELKNERLSKILIFANTILEIDELENQFEFLINDYLLNLKSEEQREK
jgi:hypothetical protein